MTRKLLLVNQTFRSPETNFPLTPGKFILGRSATCDLVVPDSTLSRRHSEITVADAAITVSDLNSQNGTYIQGVRVRSATVTEGQRVQFGRVVFLLTCPDSQHRLFDLEGATSDPQAEKPITTLEEAAAILSPAQGRVLRGLVEGYSEKQVANRLSISPHTVHNHIREIYRALDVHSRSELLALFVNGSR